MSLRARIGLLAALGVGIAVALTALAGYFTVSNQLQRSVDDQLLDRADGFVDSPFGDPALIVRQSPEAILAADLRIAVLGSNGATHVVGRDPDSAPPASDDELAVAGGAIGSSVRTLRSGDGELMRVVAVPTVRPGYALVLAQPTGPTDAILDRLQLVSVLVGGAGIALAAWAGYSIARTGLRPVTRLTEAAEHVAATGKLDPIKVEGRDEIARLAQSFNSMLAAVGESQRRQSQLVADAGHELRTPLTSMRTNIDLLAQSEQEGGLPAADRKALIADVRAQAEELTTLIGDLVELSREDPPQAGSEPVDMADVVRDALSRVRRRAPGIAFSAELHPWLVNGDGTMLDRAVTNLLDNAAKYSPTNGTVTVTLQDGTLDVSDEGAGISDDDLPHIFDRFYRSSEARGLPGSGLGLAIVRSVAERHGGTVSAGRTTSGGAKLSLTLPAVTNDDIGS